MSKRNTSKIPYVNLHAHTTAGSIFDAIGYADEHFDFCYSNGGDAMAKSSKWAPKVDKPEVDKPENTCKDFPLYPDNDGCR